MRYGPATAFCASSIPISALRLPLDGGLNHAEVIRNAETKSLTAISAEMKDPRAAGAR